MHRTRSGTDGLTDGRTVRLLYASQNSFGGIIKIYMIKKIFFLSQFSEENSQFEVEKKRKQIIDLLSKIGLTGP